MTDSWELKASKLKNYPHFDAVISIKKAQDLAMDPDRVSRHAFFPFIRYQSRWRKYAAKGLARKPKIRPIRYAARADAYIFARYRSSLSDMYEKELISCGISECVLAYRKIVVDNESKCNIHHARDAFLSIKNLKDCYAIALDISQFFESLDHSYIKSMWCRVLKTDKLPKDHYRVFKAITSYSVVDKEATYERLGFYGIKRKDLYNNDIKGYLKNFKEIPKQLCSGKEFRDKIAGGNGQKSLIKRNMKPYGIPQGSPISDLIANIYMLNFDTAIKELVDTCGGKYYRYSDDILIIVPLDVDAIKLEESVRQAIEKYGKKLKIKEEKSSVFQFNAQHAGQICRLIKGGKGKNGLEYLGFRYDGKKIYLRDSTLANLRRKTIRATRYRAITLAKRYPDKNSIELINMFNVDYFIQGFAKVEDFESQKDDYRNWTFWTYLTRSRKILGDLGRPILKQLKNNRKIIERSIKEEIAQAVASRRRTKVRTSTQALNKFSQAPGINA